MKATLDQEAIKIAYIAASSDARPVLQCVRIGEGEIVAIDGFILARRPIPTEPETGEVILVKAKDILRARKEWKAESLTIEADTDVHATITDEKSNNKVEVELVRGNYPPVENLYPTTEKKAYIALSSQLLRKILQIAGREAIKFRIREFAQPAEFVAGKTSGVIMPFFSPEQNEHWGGKK